MVPFTVKIPDSERDPDLSRKLKGELKGIFAWGIRGCLDWQRDGLGLPDSVEDATKSYREEMDVLGAFLDDCCELKPMERTSAGLLYEAYLRWCDRVGDKSVARRIFASQLREKSLDSVKSTGGRMVWVGISLLPDGNQSGGSGA